MTVTVDDQHLAAIHDVAARLREHGMEVAEVLGSLGLITGRAEDLTALQQVAGVTSVDPAVPVQLPDPGDEVQ